jgi:hypothetical protein
MLRRKKFGRDALGFFLDITRFAYAYMLKETSKSIDQAGSQYLVN